MTSLSATRAATAFKICDKLGKTSGFRELVRSLPDLLLAHGLYPTWIHVAKTKTGQDLLDLMSKYLGQVEESWEVKDHKDHKELKILCDEGGIPLRRATAELHLFLPWLRRTVDATHES